MTQILTDLSGPVPVIDCHDPFARASRGVRPEFGVTVHPDGWAWKEGEKHRWREHEGHGYWRGFLGEILR
jgi:hypothetical protein